LVRTLYPDAEDAHETGVKILKELCRFGAHPRERGPDGINGRDTEIFGHNLSNPLGISSGLDKHGEIPSQLLALGPAGWYNSEYFFNELC
jgi:dihydroorotate dehydrogenase